MNTKDPAVQRKVGGQAASDILLDNEMRHRAVFNASFQFMGVMDAEGGMLDANDTALSYAGITREEIVGLKVWDSPWFAGSELARQRLQDAVARAQRGVFVRYEETISGANSAQATIDFSIKPVVDADGKVVMLIPEGRDVTEAHVARSALRESEQRFRLSFDRAPIGVGLVGTDGEWLAVNDALCNMLGYTETELLRMTWQELTHPEDLDGDQQLVKETLAGNSGGYRFFKRYFHKSGATVYAQLDVSLLRDDSGVPLHFISQIQDITAQRQAEDALFEAKELAQVTLASIGDGVIRTDARGVISYVNDAACALLGLGRAQLIGKVFGSQVTLYESSVDKPLPDPVDSLLRLGSGVPVEPFPRIRASDGSLRPVSHTLAPIMARDGRRLGCVFVFQDVSDAHRITEQWAFQANHDSLTGLLNRRAFNQALKDMCRSMQEGNTQSVLLVFDIDHFKVVNDTCGHPAGDQMLVNLARMLRRRLRAGDLLARLGGDEFAVLLPDCDMEDAQRVAQTLLSSAANCTYSEHDRHFAPSLSIGLTAVSESDAETLARADTACYVAKQAGRGRVHVFDRSNADINRARHELDWAHQLQRAVQGEGFVLHCQPIVELESGKTIGSEILLRFATEDGRMVAPGTFFPAARRHDLCAAIDLRVLKDVLSCLQRGGLAEGFVVVNLSSQAVGDPLFARDALAALDAAALDPDKLRFEILESECVNGGGMHSDLLEGLRRRGYQIWLDDFGAGFNSFDSLRRLRPDGVKVHPRYVRQLSQEAVYRHFVDAVCKAAVEVECEVLAEGVEDAGIADGVRQLGIRYAQGFFLGEVSRVEPMAAG